MFRDVWRSLTRLVDPVDAALRSQFQAAKDRVKECEMLDIQTFRAEQMMHPHPPHRIYDYTLPHFGIQEIDNVIQMDLLGNDKTHQFLLEALRHTETTDPHIRTFQHIVLRAASGWTAHIHIPNNPDPSFYHVWVGMPAAVADGQYQKSLEDLRFHRVFVGTAELR